MKKILSLALVLVFALGMMTTVSAAKKPITGLSAGMTGTQDLSKDVTPGEDVYWFINEYTDAVNAFTWDSSVVQASLTNETAWKKALKDVNFRVRVRSGSKVVDNIEWAYGTHTDSFTKDSKTGIFVKAEIVDPFVSVDEVDFDVDIYLDIDGTRTDDDYYVCFTGTLANEVTEVSADSVEADTWEGQVVEATEYVSKIALVGNKEEDVIAHVKMANGKKIYFRVVTDGDIKDEPVFDKYPSIEWAYTVQSIGLSNTSGNFIELAGVEETYYVYGKNADGSLKYLGRGGELLPYSAKYYVSSAKLELDEDITEELPEEDEVPENSYNPSTGI